MNARHPGPTTDRYRLEQMDADADLMVLNFGPQHPSTHGVFRIKLILDGEVVVRAIPYAGYLHRGVEKLLEKLTFAQGVPIVDKNDYVSPMTNEQALVMAFEKLLKIEVPRRARWMRTIFAELQRVASHMLWLGTFALDMGGALGGGSGVFIYTFRERDYILDLFEMVTGGRFHYNTHTIGGNRHDIPAGWDREVFKVLDLIESRLPEYEAMSSNNAIFVARTKGVGVIDKDLALGLGLTGPILRASGVPFDLRRDAPYHAYDELKVNVATATAGDCQARAQVRVAELRESIRLVRDGLAGLPAGGINGGKPIKMPQQFKAMAGQAYVGIDTPRGELGTFVVAGGGDKGTAPYRCKIRAPSLHALSALPWILPGHTVSDVVVILGSLDPIMGEVDR